MDSFSADTDKNGNACVYDGLAFVCYAPDMQRALGLARTFSSLRIRKQVAALKESIEKAQKECPAPIPPADGAQELTSEEPSSETPEGPNAEPNLDDGANSLPSNGVN